MTSILKSEATLLSKVDHALQLLLVRFFDQMALSIRFLILSPQQQQQQQQQQRVPFLGSHALRATSKKHFRPHDKSTEKSISDRMISKWS